MNSLLGSLGGKNNPFQMVNAFLQFQNSFNGNAEEEVKKIINSGKYSQEDINKAQAMAKTLNAMLGSIK